MTEDLPKKFGWLVSYISGVARVTNSKHFGSVNLLSIVNK